MAVMSMGLADYARRERVHYKTAYVWWLEGKLAYPARQLPSGRIMVDVPNSGDQAQTLRTVVYARVSSHDQSPSLDGQVARVVLWATKNGHSVDAVVTEIGSALNGKRRKFLRLLNDPTVGTIIVEHRDRYCRFGGEYVEAALNAHGRRVVVVNDTEIDDDLVRDVTEVLTSLCARLYGKRSAKLRADKGMEAVQLVETDDGDT